MSGLRRGSVAVVGVAESDLGQVAPNTSIFDMMAQATMLALDDCGLKLSDIDAVLGSCSQSRYAARGLCEYLDIHPKFFDGTVIGGSSFMTHVAHAQAAIELGLCKVALIAYGSTQRTVSRAAASPRESILTNHRTVRYCHAVRTRWRPHATCTSTARRARISPKSSSPRANGR
jgi:acetyl-CoA acetyltransferase